jgi:cyclophilin family peptidyl-prolyl cis-trans isomerase/HEAT repeat protein
VKTPAAFSCTLVALTAVAGCRGAPPDHDADSRLGTMFAAANDPADRGVDALDTEARSADADVRRRAARALGRKGGIASASVLARLLQDPDGSVREEAAFGVGVTDVWNAPDIIGAWLTSETPGPEVAAAAMGLGYTKAEGTEAALIGIAMHPTRPPEALEALYNHYRWRGKPAPEELPDPIVLAYAEHPAPRGRAGVGWIGVSIKDPALLPVLEELVRDEDPEVRRAAAAALSNGRANPRPEDAATRCAAALVAALGDPDWRVVARAASSLGTYPDLFATSVPALVSKSAHPDFKARTNVIAALGRLNVKETPFVEEVLSRLHEMALKDSSTSARHTAAVTLADLDLERALPLVDPLLGDENEYVRVAACLVLAKSEAPSAAERLAEIARADRHVRVRWTALGALEEREEPVVAEAVRRALGDSDPVVVATACGIVKSNQLEELLPQVREILRTRTSMDDSDAREGAASALAELGTEADVALVAALADDPDPGVRRASRKALAERAGVDPPEFQRGASSEGDRFPGGVPAFGDGDVLLILDTDVGTLRIKLAPDAAPAHVAHVVSLARKGFYDGLTWHRVVPDFVIQGGCPRGDGAGKAGVTLPLEPTRIPYERGVLGMPRSEHPDSGGCQLFIMHSRAPHLDLHYSAFGRVVEGLDVIDAVDVDTRIRKARVEGVR